ncbi:phage protein NinX family protein [Shewanella sp.]|uniref:phage protein NinX family protein n=1 Tax=Shewanella sp. TaxID=50422 RepID=UPI001B480FEB|nr:phage protein NinX family protein [Shewanella sp.]MBP6517869.1 DUF2591 family protein [Shewanella sp.]
MNYEEMSDKHLSKLVAESIWLTVGDNLSMLRNNSSATVHDGDGYWLEFSINNPADVWLIIFENKITTEWCFDDDWRATVDNQFQAGAFNRFQSFSKNPLRAAAIVFLKMKDAEKSR